MLLRILDRYEIRVPIKGSHAWWNPVLIFITCPRLPSEELVYYDRINDQMSVIEDIE